MIVGKRKGKRVRHEHFLIFIFSIIWIFVNNNIHAQEDLALRREIEKIIVHDTEIGQTQIPGFIIGVVDHEQISISSFGSMYPDSLVPLTDTSIFELGGLTKVFTAHLCHILSSVGQLDLNTPINQYLDREYQNELLKHLTTKNLLTHTSGLPNHPGNLGQLQPIGKTPYEVYTKKDLLEYYRSIDQPTVHGKYAYSHLNYALIEIILEQITNEALDTLLQSHIAKPYAMTHTYFSAANLRETPGYDRAGRTTSPWAYQSFAASVGLKSSVLDLCSYMQRVLGDSLNGSFKNMLMPYSKISHTKKAYVADGWHLFKNKKSYNVYLHSGKTSGHAASIHFLQETKTAVILMTNGIGKMDGLATLVLRLLNDNWKRNG